MKLQRWIGLLAASFALCDTAASAQQIDLPAIKHQTKQSSAAQVEFITPEELKSKIANSEQVTIADVRGSTSFEQSDNMIKGALHAQVRKVAHRLREIPRDREVVTYCACPADEAAIIAARSLMANGFKRVRALKGGWNAWLQAGGQVQPRPKP